MIQNNKQRGTLFERQMIRILQKNDYWAHFINPNNAGAQPFDIIAVKGGTAYAIDCKTSKRDVFPISRLEENQILAFDLWMQKGNTVPLLMVLHEDKVYKIKYTTLKDHGKIKLAENLVYCTMENEN